MKFPGGILGTIAGIVINEVVGRVGSSDKPLPEFEELVMETVDKIADSLSPEELAAEPHATIVHNDRGRGH